MRRIVVVDYDDRQPADFAAGRQPLGRCFRLDLVGTRALTRILFIMLVALTLAASGSSSGMVAQPALAQREVGEILRPSGAMSLSHGRGAPAATSLGNFALFAGGGVTTSSIVDMYDASTGSWTTTRFPVARSGSTGAQSGSVALLVRDDGGALSVFDLEDRPTIADLYDVETGSWTATRLRPTRADPAAGLPTRKAVASVGTKLLVAGEVPAQTRSRCTTRRTGPGPH